jgi:hypothetical protein
MTKQIDLCKFAIIINKTHVIFFQPKESMAGPHTSEKTSSKGAEARLVDTEYGSW